MISELYSEWLLAIAYVGAIAAPLNYRWSYEEALLAMEVVRPAMLVTDDSCIPWYSKLQLRDVCTFSEVACFVGFAFLGCLLTTESIKKNSVGAGPLGRR
ncbi:hypothetical protein ACFX15_035658 [Malus domestica]